MSYNGVTCGFVEENDDEDLPEDYEETPEDDDWSEEDEFEDDDWSDEDKIDYINKLNERD